MDIIEYFEKECGLELTERQKADLSLIQSLSSPGGLFDAMDGKGFEYATCMRDICRCINRFTPEQDSEDVSASTSTTRKVKLEVELESCPYWNTHTHSPTHTCNGCTCFTDGNSVQNSELGVMVGKDRYCTIGASINAALVEAANCSEHDDEDK